jgi:fructoselysine-6-P-deglycase FrlB-like protein
VTDQADRFLADILAEPETLRSVLDAYGAADGPLDALGELTGRPVLLLGMGSSRFAALAACSLLRAHGVEAAVEHASAASPTPPGAGRLVIAISASGTTPETVEAAARHSATSPVVAVTNRPDEALGSVATVVLPLLAGEEQGGIACLTYQATVAVLLLLCGRLGAGPGVAELTPAIAAAEHLVETRERWLVPALDILGGGPLDVIAPAERQSSAEQSALMLREAPRIRAAACETGDWLHVDVYLSRPPGYRAILLPGSRFDDGVFDWLDRRGGSAIAIGRGSPRAALQVSYPGAGDPFVDLLVETTAAELLAAELWRRSLS